MNEEIKKYIDEERARGVTDEALRSELLSKGWKEADVNAGLGAVVSAGGAPLPPRKIARIGRLRYFLGPLVTMGPLYALVAIWGVIGYIQSQVGMGMALPSNAFFEMVNIAIPLLMLPAVLLGLVGVYLFIMLGIRRAHDLGHSGWFLLLTFIPYIGIVFGLYLLFKRGDQGSNKYGPPSPPDRKFFADIFNR